MILVDTSVWIGHFREGIGSLVEALVERRILGHPWVTLEIAMGSIARRAATIDALRALPQAPLIAMPELIRLVEEQQLFARGLGAIDVQLLAAIRSLRNAALWTRDARLADQGERIGLAVIRA
jgi:predicted nucleic acid-binding protein